MFHVLIIDDNLDSRETLRKYLARLGCDVTIVETAEDGINRLECEKYDAIFAALCVKDLGGRSIARWVKSRSIGATFFIVTSWKGELETNLLRLDGIHDVIHKPVSFREIREKVLEHLG